MRRFGWLVGVSLASTALIAACGGSAKSGATAASPAATAFEACRSLAGAGSWSVAVEIDRQDASVLALAWGPDIALCETSRTAAGYGAATSVGIGRHPAPVPATLTYASSSGASGTVPDVLVGRVPSAAMGVLLAFADGTVADATIANGLWLAWLDRPAKPTRIEAVDGAGAVLARLADETGIQPAG